MIPFYILYRCGPFIEFLYLSFCRYAILEFLHITPEIWYNKLNSPIRQWLNYKIQTQGQSLQIDSTVLINKQAYKYSYSVSICISNAENKLNKEGIIVGFKMDQIINENHSKLNRIDLHILNFVQNNLKLCTSLSIAELAKKCNVSTATILRTA